MAAPTSSAQLAAQSFAVKYALSALAASVAETVTFPLDITKTRLQIQGEAAAAHGRPLAYRGMLATAMGVVREEGVLALWRGLPPAVLRHFVYSGVRMGLYEQLRNHLRGSPDAPFPLSKAVVCGMTSGAVAQLLASPTDLVKVQMQMEGKRRLQGLPSRYTGTLDAFRTIVRTSGVRGLWTGWVPNVQRAALVNLGDLTAYDTAKRFLLGHTSIGDNAITHALSSTCAGLVAAAMGTPADVVKTRVMNQPKLSDGRGALYSSSVDCLVKTVRAEGFRALYKGFLPIWMRMAPWSMTFWLTHEKLRAWAGSGSF